MRPILVRLDGGRGRQYLTDVSGSATAGLTLRYGPTLRGRQDWLMLRPDAAPERVRVTDTGVVVTLDGGQRALVRDALGIEWAARNWAPARAARDARALGITREEPGDSSVGMPAHMARWLLFGNASRGKGAPVMRRWRRQAAHVYAAGEGPQLMEEHRAIMDCLIGHCESLGREMRVAVSRLTRAAGVRNTLGRQWLVQSLMEELSSAEVEVGWAGNMALYVRTMRLLERSVWRPKLGAVDVVISKDAIACLRQPPNAGVRSVMADPSHLDAQLAMVLNGDGPVVMTRQDAVGTGRGGLWDALVASEQGSVEKNRTPGGAFLWRRVGDNTVELRPLPGREASLAERAGHERPLCDEATSAVMPA